MKDPLTVLLRRLVARAPAKPGIREYLPYTSPGLAWLLERAEPIRRLARPVRSLAELESASPPGEIEEYSPCPLCGADRVRIMYRPRRRDKNGALLWSYQAGRCPHCGLLYRVPAVKADCVADLYAGGDYSAFLDGKYGTGREGKYKRTMQAFAPFLDEGRGRRLLDFGCGTGIFLKLALERGFDAFGVDYSPDAVEVARQRVGTERAWCGNPLEVPELASGGFDVIAMWSVLAHVADPIRTLEEIRSLLAPGGALLIYTVNAQSLELKAYTHAWHCFTKNHLIFWEPSTLTPLLRQAGFEWVAYRPFYCSGVERGTGAKTDAGRARIIRHTDRYQSGAMIRALAFNGPDEPAGVSGAVRL